VGEFPARVDFAGIAPGFAAVYQLNVVPQQMGSDRLFIRSQGRPSNVASIGVVAAGGNAANAGGTIEALYPTDTGRAGGYSAAQSSTGILKVRGTARPGSTFVIDGQNNSSVSVLAGYLLLPVPPALTGSPKSTGTTTIKLFIDGNMVASADVNYHVLPF